MIFMEALKAYIQKCKELSQSNSKTNMMAEPDEIESIDYNANQTNWEDETDDSNNMVDDEDQEEENDDDTEDVSDVMNKVSSFLQGFAFQHHSTSPNQPKLFPILLKAEY